MIFPLIYKKCKCGLYFQDVSFIRARIRGYCSKECRKKLIVEKRKSRYNKLSGVET